MKSTLSESLRMLRSLESLRVKDRNLIWPWSEEVHAAGWGTTQLLCFQDSSEGEFWKQKNRFSFVVIIACHLGYDSLFSLCWSIVTEYYLITLKRADVINTKWLVTQNRIFNSQHIILFKSSILTLSMQQSNYIIFVSSNKLNGICKLFPQKSQTSYVRFWMCSTGKAQPVKFG